MSRLLLARVVATLVASTLFLATSSGTGATAPAAPAPDGVWPLDPRPTVTSHFDPPDDPWGRGHRGVDLAGRVGQPVRAALAGTIGFAGRIAGRGVLVVDHGATRTTYEPVSALVAVGTPVGRGEVVGRLELAGSHCSPAACLHWGWRRGKVYLDPLDLVGAAPVRLLPLSGSSAATPRNGRLDRVGPSAVPRPPIRPPSVPTTLRRAAGLVLAQLAGWLPRHAED